MHPRVAFDNHAFPGIPANEAITRWQRIEAQAVALVVPCLPRGLDDLSGAVAAVRDDGTRLSFVMHPFLMTGALDRPDMWDAARAEMIRAIDAAVAGRAKAVYTLTGGRGALDWEEAAEAFAEAIAPVAAHAHDAGLPLLIETTTPLYADVHIAHTLADTLRVAEMAGIGVCLDIFAAWSTSGLRDSITRAGDRIGLVQVADWVAGDRNQPCRAVPGDGCISLERIIGWILETGYTGDFALELLGPRIQAEGPDAALRRAGTRLSDMLARLEG